MKSLAYQNDSVAFFTKNAVAATGQSIPLISCMGNHEFGNKVHSDEENAQYIARFEKHVGHKATQEF